MKSLHIAKSERRSHGEIAGGPILWDKAVALLLQLGNIGMTS